MAISIEQETGSNDDMLDAEHKSTNDVYVLSLLNDPHVLFFPGVLETKGKVKRLRCDTKRYREPGH